MTERTAERYPEALRDCETVWRNTLAAQLGFVLVQLALAVSFCRSASLLGGHKSHRTLCLAERALVRARRFMAGFQGDRRELKRVASGAAKLNAALEDLAFQSVMRA